jgi:hypothetical protein
LSSAFLISDDDVGRAPLDRAAAQPDHDERNRDIEETMIWECLLTGLGACPDTGKKVKSYLANDRDVP